MKRQLQFAHGFGQRGGFPLAGLLVGHRLANLNEHARRPLSPNDEIFFPVGGLLAAPFTCLYTFMYY